jgi:hypothetical protein
MLLLFRSNMATNWSAATGRYLARPNKPYGKREEVEYKQRQCFVLTLKEESGSRLTFQNAAMDNTSQGQM